MRKMMLVPVAVAWLLSGCATSARFGDALEGAVKTTKAASDIVNTSERDLIRAYAIGAVEVDSGPFTVPVTVDSLTCIPRTGPAAAADDLSVFSDATDLVAKVAKKPDDTTYAGYVAKLQANREAAVAATTGDLLKKKSDDARAAQARCLAAFGADAKSDPLLGFPKTGTLVTGANPIAIILGLDAVFKTLLSQIEAIQREDAVRATVKAVIPPMREAQKQLASTYDSSFGPVVRFDSSAPNDLVNMNRSVLGGAITLERWYVAQKITALWERLAICRPLTTQEKTAINAFNVQHNAWQKSKGGPEPELDQGLKEKGAHSAKGTKCLSDASVRADLDALIEAMYLYKSLSRLDSKKILDDLDRAITNAEQSTQAKLPDILDGVSSVANALSSMSDAFDKYQKAKE